MTHCFITLTRNFFTMKVSNIGLENASALWNFHCSCSNISVQLYIASVFFWICVFLTTLTTWPIFSNKSSQSMLTPLKGVCWLVEYLGFQITCQSDERNSRAPYDWLCIIIPLGVPFAIDHFRWMCLQHCFHRYCEYCTLDAVLFLNLSFLSHLFPVCSEWYTC